MQILEPVPNDRNIGTFGALLLTALLTYGCGDRAATTPTPVTPAQPAAAPQNASTALRVVGRVVDDDGSPVVGARIARWDSPLETTVSDGAGAFEITLAVAGGDRSFWVTVEKPGYETSELNRSLELAQGVSLPLHKVQALAAGESLSSVLTPDDSACGYHWGFVCRRVRVRSESAGTLRIDVVSPPDAELGVPTGPAGFPQPLERHVSISVSAGSELSLDIAASSSIRAPVPFSVTTSLLQSF